MLNKNTISRDCDIPRPSHTAAAYCRRRGAAAARLEPLGCGCSDPWRCTCRRAPEPNPEAILAAVLVLHAAGVTGSFTVDELRAAYSAAKTTAQRRLVHAIADQIKEVAA